MQIMPTTLLQCFILALKWSLPLKNWMHKQYSALLITSVSVPSSFWILELQVLLARERARDILWLFGV